MKGYVQLVHCYYSIDHSDQTPLIHLVWQSYAIFVDNADLKPFSAGSKFPPNPLIPLPNQYRCVLRYIVLSYSRKGFSKDFLRYDSDPGGFLVAFAIRRCVNATEATMKTARSVKEDGREVNVSVGCEAEGYYTAVTL